MSKILDAEFRKELYKNLTDAGYSKTEAQKLVGTKYYEALKVNVTEFFKDAIEKVGNDTFDITLTDTALQLAELVKLKDIISV